jgi:SAM-dependent methyltransferase
MADFGWPPLRSGDIPVWNGRGFVVAGQEAPYLSYSENSAGWDDELTSLHNRESAGLHPIDITSRYNAVSGLRKVSRGPVESILEIGSSDGHLLRELSQAFPNSLLVGSEVAPGALAQIAQEQPGMPLIQLDILNCPLPERSFDAIVALNVLEHIEDDCAALSEMARLLRVGGTLLLEVPAGPRLYDAYDRQLHHFRRYRMPDFVSKVERGGFNVAFKTHVGFFVYPAFAVAKITNRLRDRSLRGKDVVAQSIRQSRGNPGLDALFSLERRLFGVSWPFGIRCLVIAHKNR